LKWLIPAKEIQEKQSFFLGKIWPPLGLAWRGFDKFGENLAAPRSEPGRDCAESACRTSREQLGFVRDLFTREGDSPPDGA
jgi:hypothetical protein